MTAKTPIHVISGLPRSGSTLLAAILRQNPALYANITSPVGAMVSSLLGDMSAGNESAVFFTEAQREAVLLGLVVNYCDELPDLWGQWEGASTWRSPECNTQGVSVACEPAAALGADASRVERVQAAA